MTVADATRRDHMASGATCQSKLGVGVQAVGKWRKVVSRGRRERRMDGWE